MKRVISQLCFGLLLLAGSQALSQDAKPSVPNSPLTNEQLVKVRAVLQRIKTEQIDLRKQLAADQARLADCYMEFELDNHKISKHQAEIISTQKKLMESHHALHEEMRLIVGAERFKGLVKRIDWIVREHSTEASKSVEPQPKRVVIPAESTGK